MFQHIVSKIPLKKISSFIGIGLFNTVFNVALFDVLIFLLHMSALVANFLSLLVSITLSYFLNKAFVFKDSRQVGVSQLLQFLAGTFAIQLIAQHLAVWLLGEKYTLLGRSAYSLTGALHLPLSEQFVILNVAKGLGVIVSVVVAYVFYDRLIFAQPQAQSAQD